MNYTFAGFFVGGGWDGLGHNKIFYLIEILDPRIIFEFDPTLFGKKKKKKIKPTKPSHGWK